MSNTLAGYYGAMAGLGLSCIKVGVVYAVSYNINGHPHIHYDAYGIVVQRSSILW